MKWTFNIQLNWWALPFAGGWYRMHGLWHVWMRALCFEVELCLMEKYYL